MKPRITLRVHGTRIGDAARPAGDRPIEPAPGPRLPVRRALRVNASLLVRDYRDDDGTDNNGAAS